LTPSVPDPAVTERGNRYIGITFNNTAKSKISKRLLFLPITIPVGKVLASHECEAQGRKTPSDPLVGGLR
jgi:hypothetical protein